MSHAFLEWDEAFVEQSFETGVKFCPILFVKKSFSSYLFYYLFSIVRGTTHFLLYNKTG